MEARIIGPASELGDARDGLNFFGNTLVRDEWTEVKVNAEQAEKLRGNRYVEVRGDKPEDVDPVKQKAEAEEDAEEANIRARLDELGVNHKPSDNKKALTAKLEKAEKADTKEARERLNDEDEAEQA